MVHLFKFERGEISQSGMNPLAIIKKLNILKDLLFCLFTGKGREAKQTVKGFDTGASSPELFHPRALSEQSSQAILWLVCVAFSISCICASPNT
jgi:hypothetical protein